MGQDTLKIAVATRPHIEETVNGDLAWIDWSGARCRIALIDGLGHGIEAARAAERAAALLRESPELSPADALSLCDRALRGTRGAAVSVATVDVAKQRLTFSGIGNVEGRLRRPSGTERLITYRGIVGVAMRSARTFEYALDASWTLILHTDGVSARFDEQRTLDTAATLDEAARSIMEAWARERDDATIVLVRPG